MTAVFHLSFWVDELARTRQFYVEALGCALGRQAQGWFDLDFFGHQVTIHQARQPQPSVDGVGPSKRALDHFGAILDKPHWEKLLRRLQAQAVPFRVPPKQDHLGEPRESGKFVVVDPDGVGLEFKYYADIRQSLGAGF
jgi:extradiol dioxygenase family protein